MLVAEDGILMLELGEVARVDLRGHEVLFEFEETTLVVFKFLIKVLLLGNNLIIFDLQALKFSGLLSDHLLVHFDLLDDIFYLIIFLL